MKTSRTDIPKDVHFAVMYFEHGRKRDTNKYLTYRYFSDEEALKKWIIKNHNKKKFNVMAVSPVEEISWKVTINAAEE
jgi:hypothetical protein